MSEILTPQNGEKPHDERPALVLDTNTVLALWMFRDPTLDRLRQWIEAGNCRLYSRADALEELRRVLAYRQFGLDDASQQTIISGYRQRLTPCAPATNEVTSVAIALLPRCSDADDQKFLDLAAAHSAMLLSKDKAVIALRKRLLVYGAQVANVLV